MPADAIIPASRHTLEASCAAAVCWAFRSSSNCLISRLAFSLAALASASASAWAWRACLPAALAAWLLALMAVAVPAAAPATDAAALAMSKVSTIGAVLSHWPGHPWKARA